MGVTEKILSEGDDLHKFIIMLADAGGTPIRGKTKLQKMLYLLSYPLERLERHHYEQHDRGPYSEVVDHEKEYLQTIGVLYSRRCEIGLTEEGCRVAEAVAGQADSRTLEVLREYKETFNDMTTDELLAYVYLAHPENASKSAKYASLKPRMERLMLSLVKKEKITGQRAAELLGKSYSHVLKKAGESGIRVLG